MCALYFFQIGAAFSMEVAITVDDIPENGALPPHVTRMDVAKKILAVFKKHHISGVYGLINGNKIENNAEGLMISQEWIKSGQLLGNHTFSHTDLAKSDSSNYIEDIKKNESILIKLMANKNYHYFRYPYLSEGNTQEKRDTVRQYLLDSTYQIAPVTVDFFEYEWNDPYIRCITKQDAGSISWLKKNYIDQAINALAISHSLSIMLFNRDIKNILLVHINAFTAEMLDDLLTAYEKQGVKFISLAEALSDEVYAINPNIIRDRAYTFLNQVRLSRGLDNPENVNKLYESFPEDTLNKMCK